MSLITTQPRLDPPTANPGAPPRRRRGDPIPLPTIRVPPAWRTVVLPTAGTFLVLMAAAFWTAFGQDVRRDTGSGFVFTLGAVITILVSTLVFHAFRGQAVRDAADIGHLRALEKLNEIAIAISSRIDSPPDVLRQLAVAARELLDMDRSGVALLDSATQSLKVVAFAGDVPQDPPIKFALARLPLCSQLLVNGKSLLIEDVSREPFEINAEVIKIYKVTALILIPLAVGDRKHGLLALSSSVPRRFTAGEHRLAKLLGSQAAVILGNSELYARMAEAMRNQQRLFEQREALFAVNAAVYQASSFRESLQMIAELAPGVLNVDLCMVSLSGDDVDKVFIAAITQPHGAELVGKTFTRKGTNGEVVQATRRMLVVEDARRHPGVHPAFRDQLDVGSVAYLPLLRTGGEFMGMLVLIRRAAGPFSQDQLNLAELFTVRAAAAFENAQLLDQTRRDAEAKAMLLRELNHRVKNNLASIITLLSLEEPDLSPIARQWLDRAIDRIRTMARAHDLFSSGMERVALAELVSQTLPSLSVAKPASVDVRVDLTGVDVMLRTDKAVSLAMVLHELCYNAIIHGVKCCGGTVTIRGRLEPAAPAGKSARVILEVIDRANCTPELSRDKLLSGAMITQADHHDATHPNPTDVPLTRVGTGGLGLILVDGLVTRELGGSFTLLRSDHGATARVEFPINPTETTPVQ